MRKLLTFILLAICLPSFGANWYVSSTVASSGNGTSWATAWKTLPNIVWGSIAAGDTINIDGGSSGLSYAAFSTITASGTSGNYITIARSTESGRDGIVTIAAPFGITGSYIKFDGGAYKLVSGTTYRCGIVFTCSGNTTSPVNAMGGGAINCSGNNPWFRYCYFNGTYGASQGNSLCVRNAGGFIADHCWFYQSSWEDQMSFEATTTGGSLRLTNNVWENNNRNPPESIPPAHRDVINAWTGSGGYSYYIVGNIMFNTTGHSSYQPQGDEFLLQVGYPTGSGVALTEIVAVNNVCYNTARFIALGSGNTGVGSATLKNNTIRNATFGPNGTSGFIYTDQNNLGTTFATPNFLNSGSPLGSDGIPFTDDDGFLITTGSAAINAGSAVVTTDIRGYTRFGTVDIGAYELGATNSSGGGDGSPTPLISISTNTFDYGWSKVGASSNKTVTVRNVGTGGTLSGVASIGVPWSVINGSYSIATGETHDVTIVYSPTQPGSQSATVTFTGGGGASASASGIAYTNQIGTSWLARNGTLIPPMVIESGYISATGDSSASVPTDGYAIWGFTVPTAGYYYFRCNARGTNGGTDSFYVNVDGPPTSAEQTWDILPTTTGFQDRYIGWRGVGTFDAPNYPSNKWYLASGDHVLSVYRREPSAAISNIFIFEYVTNAPTQPPFIITQPRNLRMTNAQAPSSMSVVAGGDAPLTYQWKHAGTNLPGETSSSITILSTSTQAGDYAVGITNAGGGIISSTATMTLVFAPSIVLNPLPTSVFIGSTVTLTGYVANATNVQWKNGVTIKSQDTNAHSFTASLQDSGTWTISGYNEVGEAYSTPARVFVYQSSNTAAPLVTTGTLSTQ